MAICVRVLAMRTLLFAVIISPIVRVDADSLFSHAPAPSPSSDGTSVDQGIAYILMLLALILTYLIHPLDSSSYNFF